MKIKVAVMPYQKKKDYSKLVSNDMMGLSEHWTSNTTGAVGRLILRCCALFHPSCARSNGNARYQFAGMKLYL